MARAEREQAAREAAERIAFLHSALFRNVTLSRDVAALRTESQARDMFRRALYLLDNRMQVEIVCVAIENRWGDVVAAFIKVWEAEHPIAKTVQELWNLTGRYAV